MRYLSELRPLARQAWPDFEDLFERFFAPAMRARSPEGAWSPRIDIVENPAAYVVTAEVPGVDPQNIDVTLTNDTLTIRGQRQREYESRDGDQPHVTERAYGAFERSFTFPTPVSSEGVEAEDANGVITIKVPKSQESQPRKIAITSRSQAKTRSSPSQLQSQTRPEARSKPEVKSRSGSEAEAEAR